MKKIAIIFPTAFLLFVLLISWTEPDKTVMARGQKLYTTYCMACHQMDGGGVPGLNPPLEKTSYVLGSKTKLIRVLLKGMNTHEDIDGESYSNTMAPFNYLSNQQISDVLTYVRNSFGNKATVVTPGDVKYVRDRTR
jgi:mono/diheme cytochrome c family protein